MDDLRQIVTSALEMEEGRVCEQDPLRVASERRGFYLGDAEEALLWGIEEISRDPASAWEVASLVAALSVHFPSPLSSDSRRVMLLLDAKRLSQNPNSEGLGEMLFLLRSELHKVRREISRQKRKALVGSAPRAIEFLADFFEDFPEELSLVGGVSGQTAHRWISRGNVSPEHAGKIIAWGSTFYMLEELGEDPVIWWQACISGDRSPRDYFAGDWLVSPPQGLRAEIDRIQKRFRLSAL